MSDHRTEADVLHELIPELVAEGYEVFVHPDRPIVPSFLKFQPDVIAKRPDKNLAIEVVRRSKDTEARLKRIAEEIRGHPDWELRIVWVEPTATGEQQLPTQDRAEILGRLVEMQALARDQHFAPALVLGWAALEAAARLTLAREFGRPQTPGRVVSVLAGEGYLTPTLADNLRTLISKRNALVHGVLNISVSQEDIQLMDTAVRQLLDANAPPK